MAKAIKEVWDEGTVWVRHTDKEGAITYQEHRCWNVGNFMLNLAKAALSAGGESKVERVDEKTYKRWMELQRRHQ